MIIAVTLCGQLSREFSLDLTFGIPGDGVTALLGPSGSGKTCVLRGIAGLDRYRGRICFGEEVWQDAKIFVPPHLRRIGYVFQGAGLLPHLTVRGNLEFAIKRAPFGPFELDDVIARTGIAALLDRSPARLSGGELQRAAIGRALMSQPRLLLMDEPLSGLDSDSREVLTGELDALLTAIPVPTIYVTHDIAEAQRVSVRAIRLDAGRLSLPRE